MYKRFMQRPVGLGPDNSHSTLTPGPSPEGGGRTGQVTDRAGDDRYRMTSPGQVTRQFMMTRSAWLVESSESLVD